MTRLKDMGKKPCGAWACQVMIPHHLLMCPRHWRLVPRELQAEVYSTFDAWCDGKGMTAHKLAACRAMLAVAEKEGQPQAALNSLRDKVTFWATRAGKSETVEAPQ